MQFVTKTFRPVLWMALVPTIFFAVSANSQINSPYSRFGLGDIRNSTNVVNRAMGGLTATYIDYQSINFLNPASYTGLQSVTFDVGVETEMRKLFNKDRTESHTSANLIFNYASLGMPLMKDKKGATRWGLAMGLRPYTRVSYKILEETRLPGIDSSQVFYQGNGGAYRAFVGTGFRIGGLSIGVNGGFLFGQQDLITRRTLVNDSVFYFNSMQQKNTVYSKFSTDAGFVYRLKLNKKTTAKIGGTGFLGHTMNANQDRLWQTYLSNSAGGIDSLDVVEKVTDQKVAIEMPAGYTAGVSIEREGRWMVGAEYGSVRWSNYRVNGQTDHLANSEMFRLGGYFIPSSENNAKYFQRVAYRAGFYTGKDAVVANGTQLPSWGATFGMGLPVRRFNNYSYQFTTINTAIEFGRRGNDAAPISENYIRFSVGLSLSDLWFVKRRFD